MKHVLANEQLDAATGRYEYVARCDAKVARADTVDAQDFAKLMADGHAIGPTLCPKCADAIGLDNTAFGAPARPIR